MTRREYFNKMFALFETDGWKLFMEEVEKDDQSFREDLTTAEDKDIYRAQGSIYYINKIKTLENVLRYSYDEVEGELDAPL